MNTTTSAETGLKMSILMAALVCGAAGGGCSLLFVDGPPTTHRSMSYFDCTSSQVAPVVDLVIGGLDGLGVVGDLTDGNGTARANSDLIAPAALAALFLASAVHGYFKVSACKEAKLELMMRLRGPDLAAPQPTDPWLNPGPGWHPTSAPPPPAAPPASAPAP